MPRGKWLGRVCKAGYPNRFAPFVYLAWQVMLENDLLMVGFSGDNPNFAAWTGWVHAEMAPYARPVFLAGPLDLNGPGRDRFRARGIAPNRPESARARPRRSRAA